MDGERQEMTVIPMQEPWRHNVRLVKCIDDVVKPCPRCKHHFGEHTFDGRCLACMREHKTLNDPNSECNVNMHDAWPDLVPAIA